MTGRKELNGTSSDCPMKEAWEKYMKNAAAISEDIQEKVHQTHSFLETVSENLSHLKKLDKLEDIARTNSNIESSITEVKDNLIGVATGKDQIPSGIVKDIFLQQAKQSRANFWISCIVITALVGALVFLLTGEKLGWINPLHKAVIDVS